MKVGFSRSPGRNHRLRTPCPYPRALDNSFFSVSASSSPKKKITVIKDKKTTLITLIGTLIWVSFFIFV